MINPNIQDVESYFKFLSTNSDFKLETFTYSFFMGEGEVSYTKWGTVDAIIKDLANQKDGTTLHTTLNKTNLKGRKTSDIESVRVLCLDLDRETERDTVKEILREYEPSLIIESSPKRYHLYWKIDPSISLDTWSKYQLALAGKFNGDKELRQITKLIRVPGVVRETKGGETFTPAIIYLAGDVPVLGMEELNDTFPWYEEEYKGAIKEQQKERKALNRAVRDKTLATDYLNKREEGRNVYLYSTVKEMTSNLDNNLSFESVLSAGKEVNYLFSLLPKGSLDEKELYTTVKSAYIRGKSLRDFRLGKIKEAEGLLVPVPEDKVEEVEPEIEKVIEEVMETSTNGNHTYEKEVKGIVTGHVGFKYDYSDPYLKQNRFNDFALVARCLQRFGHLMLVVDKQFYAFNDRDKTWKNQEFSQHRELFEFFQVCALDIINDPLFIKEECSKEDGTFSYSRQKRAQEKWLGLRLHSYCVKALLNSNLVKRATNAIFDNNPEMILLSNGVLNIRTLEFRIAKPEDYLLKCVPISLPENFKEIPEPTEWIQFLKDIFSDNSDVNQMVNFIQELFGYSISGHIREQKIFCHYGSGCNGKSKLLQALRKITGGYSAGIEPDDLVRSKGAFAKSFERLGAKIEGTRVVVIDDLDVDTVWNESFVKNITSETLRARAEYERSREVRNQTKVHLGLNVAPTPQTENYGIIRRLCLIPYNKRFEPCPVQNNRIDALIEREKVMILKWACLGYQKAALQGGVKYPEEAELAIEEYKEEHFVIEDILKGLYKKGRGEEFEFNHDIISQVKETVRERHGSYRNLTNDEIILAVKTTFGVNSEKKWCGERKNMFRGFCLKCLFDKTEPKSVL